MGFRSGIQHTENLQQSIQHMRDEITQTQGLISQALSALDKQKLHFDDLMSHSQNMNQSVMQSQASLRMAENLAQRVQQAMEQ